MTDIEKRTGMTDAECEYWDDYFTNNPYEPGPNLMLLGLKPGFANIPLQLSELDKEVISYLCVQAEEFHKNPTQVINDLVREKLAVGVTAPQR
jgi:hypothetical protein